MLARAGACGQYADREGKRICRASRTTIPINHSCNSAITMHLAVHAYSGSITSDRQTLASDTYTVVQILPHLTTSASWTPHLPSLSSIDFLAGRANHVRKLAVRRA